MTVVVMSRDAAMRYCSEYHNKPAIMISISDPYITYPTEPYCSNKEITCSNSALCFSQMQINPEKRCL